MPPSLNHYTPRHFRYRAFCASVLFLIPLTCLAVKIPADKPAEEDLREEKRKESGPAALIAEEESLSTGLLQVQVMDFADQYLSAMGAAIDQYILREPDSAKRVAAQYWKVRYGSAAMAIATSRDPRTNLLDMVVFISVGRWAVDSYWVPKVFGSQAAPLSKVSAEMEENIWASARRVLSLKQASDLRELIRQWERANPRIHEVAGVRLRNLDGVTLSDFDNRPSARGILAGLRKFLGKVDTSLLYGERVMFYMQHTPHILSQQTELTLAQIGEAFPIAAVKPDSLADSIKDLPALLQEGIDRQQGSLSLLLPQIGTTLESANSLAQNLDKTLVSVQELAGKAEASGGMSGDPAQLVKEASLALAHLDSSISGLNRLLERNDAGELKSEEISRQIDARAAQILDAAFRRILILLGVVFCCVLVLLFVAKRLFFPEKRSQPSAHGDHSSGG